MERRQAIRNLALLSSGMVLMPACKVDLPIGPTYENLLLDADQLKLIEYLTNAILPKGDLEIITPEPTTHFVLRMINDCFEPEDIQRYLTGLKIFTQFVQDKYQTSPDKLNPEQNQLVFAEIMQSELLPESLPYFLNTTKQLTVYHFTTSEYFMKNHLGFEFVPGRYVGCVNRSNLS